MFKRIALSVVLASSLAMPLDAQEPGQLGFVIQTPAAIGVIWNASKAVAFRPDLNVSRSSSSSSVVGDNTSTSWTLGLSAPLYLSDADNLRTYFSPRVSYTRVSLSASGATSSQSSTAFSLSYGVQWAAMKRLHFFGEVGPQYSRSSTSTFDTDNWGLRSSLGLVLFSSKD